MVRWLGKANGEQCVECSSERGEVEGKVEGVGGTILAAFLRLMEYALISTPPLLLLVHPVTQFPGPQETVHIHLSLVGAPRSKYIWDIYNEDYFPGCGYAALPHGQISLRSDHSPRRFTWIRYDTGS